MVFSLLFLLYGFTVLPSSIMNEWVTIDLSIYLDADSMTMNE